jgi:hypothetical protein
MEYPRVGADICPREYAFLPVAKSTAGEMADRERGVSISTCYAITRQGSKLMVVGGRPKSAGFDFATCFFGYFLF